jgi:hypothetical protein
MVVQHCVDGGGSLAKRNQQQAALGGLFGWLVDRQVSILSPAARVRGLGIS